MTPSQPPRLATWLLKHFGCSNNNDAVIGDLAERYQHGKTAGWYWHQALTSIVVTAFSEIRTHPLLNLRAALLGWIVLRYVLLIPAAVVLGSIGDAVAGDAWRRGELTAIWFAFIVFALAALSAVGMASGWIVARLHARRRTAILFSRGNRPADLGHYQSPRRRYRPIPLLDKHRGHHYRHPDRGIARGRTTHFGGRNRMTPSQPPRLATWLLENFGCNADNEAVLGDLAERRARDKTAAWYWTQVTVTIAVGAFHDIRHHKLATIRDLIIGMVMQSTALGVGFHYQNMATQRWSAAELFPTINLWVSSWTYADFTIFYWHVQTVIGSVIPLLAGIVAGWIVAKLHHSSRRSTHLAFCATLLILWILYLLGENLDLPYWWAPLEVLASLEIVGAFIGGLLMRKPKPTVEVA